MVGPFIFVDQFGPARLPAGQGMDVRPHPHINLATVTYLFEGAIEHRDSIGSHAVIEPGAINLMTAGSGIVHSERSPEALRADGPGLYGMQTWLALPDGREEIAPAFDQIASEGLPVVESKGARARVLMGSLWGATAATPQHSSTIYADIELSPAGAVPIDADADERGVMLVGGEADARWRPARALHALRAQARPFGAAVERARRTADAARRRGLHDPALRVLELRLVVARPDQPGQGRLEGGALCAGPRRRPGVHPAPGKADHGQLSVSEFRRVTLRTGVTLNVAQSGDPGNPAVILLHGFPESHRTWRGVAPLLEDGFHLVMPDQRGFAGSDRPSDVAAYSSDVLVDDIFALADALGLEQFALVGHDWGGAIAWPAALRGDPRLTRLAIVNAPHPVIFQKSLIESAEQRAASQYINAFRTPGFERIVERHGLDWFFDKTFSAHVDLATIPEAEKRQYLADWAQPGALAAMLNWYRASRLLVPPPGATLPLPDWLLAAFPSVTVPTLVVWGMKDSALLPLQLDGLDRLVDDLTVVRVPNAGHFAPWEAPDEVAAALLPFLAAPGAASGAGL